MPKRPLSHQLEDASRTRFRGVLPRSWVFRDKPSDYGVDGEVEVFDEAGNATGLTFLVQLKSTSTDERRITLKTETLNADLLPQIIDCAHLFNGESIIAAIRKALEGVVDDATQHKVMEVLDEIVRSIRRQPAQVSFRFIGSDGEFVAGPRAV